MCFFFIWRFEGISQKSFIKKWFKIVTQLTGSKPLSLVLSGYPHCRYREEDKDLESQMLAKGLRLATLRQRKESQVWNSDLKTNKQIESNKKRNTFRQERGRCKKKHIEIFFHASILVSLSSLSVHGIPSVL